jgi:hypothetical protein
MFEGKWPRSWQLAILGAAVIAVWALLIWAFEAFLSSRGPASSSNWTAAITAATTLSLAFLTGMYVYLTYRLLLIQSRPQETIRLAAREEAARQLMSLLFHDAWVVNYAAHAFPQDANSFPDEDPYTSEQGQAIDQLADSLASIGPLLPDTLRLPILEFASLLYKTNAHTSAFMECVEWERTESSDTDPPTYVDAAAHFYTSTRPTTSGRPEWDALLSGETLKEAVDSLQKLRRAAIQYFAVSPN